MSLHKAIASGKEHRKEYVRAKLYDRTCRNHGGYRGGAANQCPWCLEDRLYRTNKKKEQADTSLKEFLDND